MLKKPSSILLIDDEPDYCRMLTDEARSNRYLIHCFHTLEEGIAHLEKNQKIRAVVLDSRCALDDEQDLGSIKTNFVFHAMDQINRIEHQQNRYIPFMVFADELFDLEKDLDGLARVISKKQGSIELFRQLDEALALLPEIMVREKHPEIFDFLENYCSDHDEDLMESLLMQAEKSDPHSIITNIALTRRLLEKLFDVLAVNVLAKKPESFEVKTNSRTRSIMDCLAREKLLPPELRKTASHLYGFSSKYGNHNLLGSENSYFPGSYAVVGNVNLLLELWHWASDTLESLTNVRKRTTYVENQNEPRP